MRPETLTMHHIAGGFTPSRGHAETISIGPYQRRLVLDHKRQQRNELGMAGAMYTATTRDITVRVQPQFLAEQSDPAADEYFWLYSIRIENGGTETVQLLSRHWIITNANGHVEEVEGPGVVGEQPVLGPGESFEYTSGCPLTTPSGIMAGTYEMAASEGPLFEIEIPAFSLDSPFQPRQMN